jgi:ABC-type dipeptide/oligopeptide/nickel transport system permease subunit
MATGWRWGVSSLRGHGRGLVGVALVALVGLSALAAAGLAPYDPFATSAAALRAPGRAHPMGTDDLGRDILSQVIWGSRVSLAMGLVCGVGSTAVGILVGAAAGYRGGWLDDLLMRVTEIFMILPRLLLAVVTVALVGPGLWSLIFVIGILSWPGAARLVRGEFRTLRSREFVEAARSLGESEWRVAYREILPNYRSGDRAGGRTELSRARGSDPDELGNHPVRRTALPGGCLVDVRVPRHRGLPGSARMELRGGCGERRTGPADPDEPIR